MMIYDDAINSKTWEAGELHSGSYKMEKPIGYLIFGIQALGIMSIFFALFVLPWFGGAFDIMDYDFPGLRETCIILPISVVIAAVYPKLKKYITGDLYLVLELIINVVLATQVLRLLDATTVWFR
jgi:hypothetical protein